MPAALKRFVPRSRPRISPPLAPAVADVGPSTDQVEQAARGLAHDVPLPRLAQHIQWGRAAHRGDRDAAAKLVFSIEPFVHRVIRCYGYGMGLRHEQDLEDVLAECRMVLYERAVPKWIPGSFAWTTYAAWWIRYAVTRWRDNNARTIRVPVYISEKRWHIAKVERALKDGLGRWPDDRELAEAADVSVGVIQGYRLCVSQDKTVSLDDPLPGYFDRDSSHPAVLGDYVTSDAPAHDAQLEADDNAADFVRRCIAVLTDKERAVLVRRFGLLGHEERTLQEVGDWLGVSRERVRQIEVVAIKKLQGRLQRKPAQSRSSSTDA